jgi:hypothetical protein
MKLEMFVFTEVLTDYTDGLIAVIAESRREAIELYIEKEELDREDRWDARLIEELESSHWYSLPLEKGSRVRCHGGG